MFRFPLHLALLGLLALAPAAAAQSAPPTPAEGPGCAAPPELLDPGLPLPVVARAIAAGELRILVIGSASVLAPGGSGPGAAWPARLEALLQARRPGLRIALTVRGARGLSATDQLGLLTQELAHGPWHLVIWQTGTVEVSRNLEVDEMVEALNTGLERVQAAGADAMLMDPQFSRFLRANGDVDLYRNAMRLVAAAHAVPLLRRYELMRHWIDTERVDVERATRATRATMVDGLNDCLARAVAAMLRQGVVAARP